MRPGVGRDARMAAALEGRWQKFGVRQWVAGRGVGWDGRDLSGVLQAGDALAGGWPGAGTGFFFIATILSASGGAWGRTLLRLMGGDEHGE